jgi:hypothetical protein
MYTSHLRYGKSLLLIEMCVVASKLGVVDVMTRRSTATALRNSGPNSTTAVSCRRLTLGVMMQGPVMTVYLRSQWCLQIGSGYQAPPACLLSTHTAIPHPLPLLLVRCFPFTKG